MRFLADLRGIAGLSRADSAPEDHLVAISFELLPDLLRAGDPRLVPDVVSGFWAAKLSNDPKALTTYEYFAAKACCPGLLPAGVPGPVESDAVRHWCATRYRAVIREADPFFSAPPVTLPNDSRPSAFDSPERAVFIYRDHHTIAGLSTAARLTHDALAKCGFAVIDLDFFFGRHQIREEYLHNVLQPGGGKRSSLHLFHLNPEYVPECTMLHLSRMANNSYRIGHYVWELSDASLVHECGLALMDEIWVPSQYVKEIYQKRTSGPIHVMGYALELPQPDARFTRAAFGLPDDAYIFLVSFDAGSIVERKNPLAAVRAFRKAFPAGTENAILVLKTRNLETFQTEHDRNHWQQVKRIAAADRRIQIIDRTMTSAELTGLTATSNCYVSLHRSEGFGYGPADAMGLGKPVITTAYSGVTDFCTSETAFLVNYTLQQVPRGAYPYMDDSREYYWASPDIDHAASQMRQLYLNPKNGEALAQRGREFIVTRYSLEAFQRRCLSRLADLGWF
jgi:glycosyltransferase involved in cell wall biosynthesis